MMTQLKTYHDVLEALKKFTPEQLAQGVQVSAPADLYSPDHTIGFSTRNDHGDQIFLNVEDERTIAAYSS